MVPRLAIYDAVAKPRAPMGAHTRLCYSTYAGIKVPSHDPLRTTSMCYFHMSSSLVISPYILLEDLYVEPDTIGLPSEVVQRITFEEQVTDKNNNRLQEMVDK